MKVPAVHPTRLLRLEGVVVLMVAVLTFQQSGASWWWFAAGVLAPDFSMVGYLAGNSVGALCYNLAHTYALPLSLATILWLSGVAAGVPMAAVWCAHIALDRALGYGLKFSTGFHDTHLGTIGRQHRVPDTTLGAG